MLSFCVVASNLKGLKDDHEEALLIYSSLLRLICLISKTKLKN